jgi:hypothetical protein
LRGGSGLLNGWHGILFGDRCARFIPLPCQVRGFPA